MMEPFLPPKPRQGLRSFGSFPAYLEGWIRPNLLTDLDTVFVGAQNHWQAKQRAADGRVSDGRGDFVLATALFTIFDHIGSFIARDTHGPQSHHECIARTAYCLPSTHDVYFLVANLARNALVHNGWPQTALPLEDGSWGVGLGICADPNSEEHELIYTRSYAGLIPQEPERVTKVVKLVLNVNVLLHELREWVLHGEEMRSVTQEVFEHVRRRSMVAGDPYGLEQPTASPVAAPSGSYHLQRLCCRETLVWQAKRLRSEAKAAGVWGVDGVRCKRPTAARPFEGYVERVRRLDHDRNRKRNFH